MPTRSTPCSTNQSRSSRSSGVVVPNVRSSTARLPSGPGRRTQATTVALWTSRPAQRSTSISTYASRLGVVTPRSLIAWSLYRALEAAFVGSRGSRVPLAAGHGRCHWGPTSQGDAPFSFPDGRPPEPANDTLAGSGGHGHSRGRRPGAGGGFDHHRSVPHPPSTATSPPPQPSAVKGEGARIPPPS